MIDGVRSRLHRALRRSPRYLVWRAIDSARRRARRPWAYLYPRLLTERALLVLLGARDVDRLWSELAEQPFFVASSGRSAIVNRFSDTRAATSSITSQSSSCQTLIPCASSARIVRICISEDGSWA